MPAQAMALCAVCLWCYDNCSTPCLAFRSYLVSHAQGCCMVVSLGQRAVMNLTLHGDGATFVATFSGYARHLRIGYSSMVAAFAQDTGCGLLLHGAAYQPDRRAGAQLCSAGVALRAEHADLAHR
ncbi:Stringent starvation protein B [Candidatus Tremblaya princeps]|uniref:Stringent starvation protein B n=1 Tax=Tremblaya princeps TaxID=189385 RepID=A0A143WNZ9_TREPR|nr:Stringent starvation protein B [Candidatus Tremblaya princeps]